MQVVIGGTHFQYLNGRSSACLEDRGCPERFALDLQHGRYFGEKGACSVVHGDLAGRRAPSPHLVQRIQLVRQPSGWGHNGQKERRLGFSYSTYGSDE